MKPIITRRHAVDLLRARLLTLTDDDHSMCEVASRLDLYCRGFSRWTFEELKQRYDWLVDRHPGIGPDALRAKANAWQLGRQELHQVPLSCDTQQHEHDTCLGWDEFTNRQLEDFLRELGGPDVTVGEGAPADAPTPT